MKNKSELLMSLLAAGCLIGCTSVNKNASLNENFLAKQKVTATTEADLIKADRPDQYYEIGRHYQKSGNYGYAAIAYQKSLQLDPSYTKSITGLATVYSDQKLYIIAIPLFEQVVKLEPNAINYNNLGYVYYLNNQHVEANRVLTQAIMLEPDYLQAQRNLALVASNQPVTANNDLTQQKSVSLTDNLKDSESGQAVVNSETEASSLPSPTTSSQPIKQDVIGDGLETNGGLKIVQSENGIYELKANPVAVSTANVTSTHTTETQVKPNNILVAISGGITFQHIPVISKLFDLASNQIASFNISDNSQFVEIVNGNGIKGMARAVASKFQESSTLQTKVADAKRFNQMKTHIQYKTGYRDDAVSLNHQLLNKPYLVRNDSLPSDVALRLVLGRDLMQEVNSPAITVEYPSFASAT